MSDRTDIPKAEAELSELISFLIADEEYGLQIQRVKEIIRTPEITRLPQAPTFIMGVINLRGDVIPIVDLRRKFGFQPSSDTRKTRVIVVDFARKLVGIKVDAANQVVRIRDDQIEPPPSIIGGIPAELIIGVGKLDERLIVLLDIDKVLSDEERQSLDRLESSNHESSLPPDREIQNAL